MNLESYVPFLVSNIPVFQGGLCSPTHHFLSAYYIGKPETCVTVSYEFLGTNRLDSYVSNFLDSFTSTGSTSLVVNSATEKTVSLVQVLKRVDAEELRKILAEPVAKPLPSFITNSPLTKSSEPDLLNGFGTNSTDDKSKQDQSKTPTISISAKSQPVVMDDCPFNFLKTHEKGIKFQATAANFCEKLSVLAVGLNNGKILAFPLGPQSLLPEQTYSGHNGSLVFVTIDENKLQVIGVSSEGSILAFDIKTAKIVGKGLVPGKSPSAVNYDKKKKLMFVANLGQSVYVVSIETDVFEIKNKISMKITPPLTVVTTYLTDKFGVVIAGSETGLIRLIGSKEISHKVIATKTLMDLKGPQSPRSIYYSRGRQELFVGYDNGCLKVFAKLDLVRAAQGKPIEILQSRVT